MYDVIIIGGGATGTSIFRDLALRGLKTALIERKHLAVGCTGNCHGNLLGGMRYVITDPIVAKDCAKENKILTNIASNIVGNLNDYFVGINNDYTEKALKSAHGLDVKAEILDLKTARNELDCLSPKIDIVVETDDKNIDPKRFCILNCKSATSYDATLIENCDTLDVKNGNGFEIVTTKGVFKTQILVNATGAWANEITQKVGVTINIKYSRGTILLQKALCQRGVQHLHPPSDGDAYKVHGEIAYLGTTSINVNSPYAEPESWEDDYLREKISLMIPDVKKQPAIKMLAGIRPLPDSTDKNNGREISRDMTIVDNPEGLITVIGGKLTIARLMAEKISDDICRKLNIKSNCSTAKEMLPHEG